MQDFYEQIKLLFLDCHYFAPLSCGIVKVEQGTKKFRSNSPGLADFVVGVVEFILHLPDGLVKIFGEIFL